MLDKSPHPIDIYVGMRLRMRRTLRRISQERLGEELGVTFQQVQKYEKGTNRVSASRLYEIAQILEVPVSYFFDGADEGFSIAAGFAEDETSDELIDFLRSGDGMRLARSFQRIENPALKRSVVEHVEALATPA
ncbi:helix-turn-helix domain-containing protein [Futiania mangrovi]|uniref:Helix-turn-helix transcriptional regulator n=1 Tax=Futiania mangrovi TaxID=2959716 RepID=A0A9J6PIP5_9PROT|nr:helix-turn-helix transcriptional regulator [Futiania mangrovii]MCP1336423.1 helix-turn-helix transcriptional regulator [Futiania mangrovii]